MSAVSCPLSAVVQPDAILYSVTNPNSAPSPCTAKLYVLVKYTGPRPAFGGNWET